MALFSENKDKRRPGVKPITHIMVALAFGEYTEGIFAYAAQLAEQFDARLLVASVINTRDVKAVRTVSAMGYEVDGAHYVEEIRKERRESVDRLVNQAGFPTERLKVVIEVGHPIESLLKLTVDYDVDAVVMGLQGRSNLEHIFVGSVAEKVFRRCPVTVISYRGERTAAKLKKRIS
jgi:nucleotide-binding universal stress UspA family protein